MSLGDTTLWGDVLPGGPSDLAGGSIDTTQVIDELLPMLHAAARADLVFWTEGDLLQWLDESLKTLSRVAAVFVGRVESILTVAGQAAYGLPLRHISTLHVSHITEPMRPSGTMEMEVLDPDYQTTPGTPVYWYPDLQGVGSFGVAPVPNVSDEILPLIYVGWPQEIDAGGQNTLVAAPAPLKGYLAFSVLAQAYGREGEMEAPDIAAHCRGRVEMYHEIFRSYYGPGI